MFNIPHITNFKRRWQRRAMLCVLLPIEIVRAAYQRCVDAKACWSLTDEAADALRAFRNEPSVS